MKQRGYALLFVLILMVALGVVVGGLLSALAESVASSRAQHEDLQQMYGCDGAVRLALDEASRHSGDVDNSRLQADLGILAAALSTDINPRTGRPFADLSSINAETSQKAVLTASTLPFMGVQFIEEGNRITVAANTDGGRGRACQAEAPNRRRTTSYFQFGIVSTDVITAPTNANATAGTAGDLFLLTHSMPGVPRRQTTPRGGFNIQHINLGGGDIFRPTPPSGQPWRFVNKSKRLGGLLGNKRKKKARRPTLESFVKYPVDLGGIEDPSSSRFVKGTDLRIIDGDWFIPNSAGTFPGRRIWSDQPSASNAGGPLQFSSYERDGGGPLGGAAIVKYGLVQPVSTPGNPQIGKPVVRGFCASSPDKLGRVSGDGTIDCGAGDAVAVTPANPEPDPFLAAASIGFLDPSNDTPILPIVVDVAALRAAMVTTTAPASGDVGEARCLGNDAVLCPVDKKFKGSVWIGSLPGGALPNGSANIPCPLVNHPAPTPAILSGLSCTRPNAVVLINVDDLTSFATTGAFGLSIGSNLPMYVVGDVNSKAPASNDARVALLAPQITALSRDFDFEARAWGSAAPIPSSSATLTWNASLFTSWGPDSTAQRDPARHVLRQIENNVDVNLTGSVVVMFTREQYVQKTDFNKKKGSYSSSPDPAVQGLPVFTIAGDPGESGRFAGGSVRFPGKDPRDLRDTRVEMQPPNAPRLSIDLQPLDKR